MYTEMALTARRFAPTLAVAGVAALGSVALAPATSAAQDAPGATVENKSHGNGPDAWLQLEHRKMPVFFCDAEEPKQHAKECIDLTAPTRF